MYQIEVEDSSRYEDPDDELYASNFEIIFLMKSPSNVESSFYCSHQEDDSSDKSTDDDEVSVGSSVWLSHENSLK